MCASNFPAGILPALPTVPGLKPQALGLITNRYDYSGQVDGACDLKPVTCGTGGSVLLTQLPQQNPRGYREIQRFDTFSHRNSHGFVDLRSGFRSQAALFSADAEDPSFRMPNLTKGCAIDICGKGPITPVTEMDEGIGRHPHARQWHPAKQSGGRLGHSPTQGRRRGTSNHHPIERQGCGGS